MHFSWPSPSKGPVHGDIGRECRLRGAPPSTLIRARVLRVPRPPGLMATIANNLQMRMASEGVELHHLCDDDQLMTVPGWNVKAALPLRTWPDVFSSSMRCGHGYSCGFGSMSGSKCTDPRSDIRGVPWQFFARDSGNRGPLTVRAASARHIGFMDEVHHAGHITLNCDHEMNARAYTRLKQVSGYTPVPYTEERVRITPAPAAPNSSFTFEAFKGWFSARRGTFPPVHASPCVPHDGIRQFPAGSAAVIA